jgi:hypothetical protein
MNKILIFVALSAILLAGCEPNNDQNTKVDSTAKVEKTSDDPAKQALLPAMTATAKKQAGWTAVPEAEKAPFLQYHNNDAAQAEKHYKTLAEMAAAGEL